LADRRSPRFHPHAVPEELSVVFRDFPDASFSFDSGHAKQVDTTITESRPSGSGPFSESSRDIPLAFRELAHLIPEPQIDA
jgi:hypothetical protein